MRLADYFGGQFPTNEEIATFSPEEHDTRAKALVELLEAFLVDAEGNSKADPEEIALAQVLLTQLRKTRQTYLGAVQMEEEGQQVIKMGHAKLQQAEEVLRLEFAALSDQELHTLMQQTMKQYGAESADFQRLLRALRHVAPERVALALDS